MLGCALRFVLLAHIQISQMHIPDASTDITVMSRDVFIVRDPVLSHRKLLLQRSQQKRITLQDNGKVLLSSLHTLYFICFAFSVLCFTLPCEFLPFLLTVRFFLASLPISLHTPTCSDIDCYARRIAPYTLTWCCKSFIENIEVFLGEACITSAFGCSLCSWLGAEPVPHFQCCSSVALCLKGYTEEGWPVGRIIARHTITTCRTGIQKTDFSVSISVLLCVFNFRYKSQNCVSRLQWLQLFIHSSVSKDFMMEQDVFQVGRT